MKQLVASLVFAFACAGCATTAEKVVGVWKATKIDGKEVKGAEATELEFTRDGLLKINGRAASAYSVAADKITVTSKDANGQESTRIITIRSASGDILWLTDERDKKEYELRKR